MFSPERNPLDTQPVRPPRAGAPAGPRKKDNAPLTAYLIGLLSGILIMLVIGLAAFGFGFLPPGGSGNCPAPGACPPTVGLMPVCPTCAPLPTYTIPAASPIPPTPTLDIGATATAACEEFIGLFPGTPCP